MEDPLPINPIERFGYTPRELRYKKTIEDLRALLDEYEQDTSDVCWIRNKNTIETYQRVFGWLNQQEWYQNHQHEVKKYVDNIVEIPLNVV